MRERQGVAPAHVAPKKASRPPLAEKPVRKASVSAGIAWAQCNGLLVFRLGSATPVLAEARLRAGRVLQQSSGSSSALSWRGEHLRANFEREAPKKIFQLTVGAAKPA